MGSDTTLEALARAYDAEDASQRGEPSPWDDADWLGDKEWISERLACAAAALAALKAVPAEPVAVKALEWDDREFAGQATALGLTYTMQNGRDGWFVSVAGEYLPGDFETREQAKAVAQSDFEARIRSCLATPQPLPAIEGGREPVATLLPSDPYDERGGPWFSQEDLKRLATLPAGTKLYAGEKP